MLDFSLLCIIQNLDHLVHLLTVFTRCGLVCYSVIIMLYINPDIFNVTSVLKSLVHLAVGFKPKHRASHLK